jgi:hypothetical protein
MGYGLRTTVGRRGPFFAAQHSSALIPRIPRVGFDLVTVAEMT